MTRKCASADCSVVFALARHPNGGWRRKRFCSARCQGRQKRRNAEYQAAERRRNRNRQSYINRKGREARDRDKDWGAWWECQRLREDRAELRQKAKRWPQRNLRDRPKRREFLGWICAACGEPFVYFTKRAQSCYCSACNEAHHRRPANRRARQRGAAYEVIEPSTLFERDGYRCQLCGRRTSGEFPAPTAPTVDHIIPLARGGDHLYTNVQCACFECNFRKQDGAANDQLLLVG